VRVDSQLCRKLVEVLVFISESHSGKSSSAWGSDRVVPIFLKPSVHNNLSPVHTMIGDQSLPKSINRQLLQATDQISLVVTQQAQSHKQSVISSN
jgi:hypothetical protein